MGRSAPNQRPMGKSRSFVPNHSWTRRTHRRNTRGHVTHTGAKFTRERDVFDTDLLVAGATAAGDRTPMTLVRFWQEWLSSNRTSIGSPPYPGHSAPHQNTRLVLFAG